MGPKIEAVIRFLKAGGRRALITNPESLPARDRGPRRHPLRRRHLADAVGLGLNDDSPSYIAFGVSFYLR